jgi:hypothetical protein
VTDLFHVSGREKFSRGSRPEACLLRTESSLTRDRATKKRAECRSRRAEMGQKPVPLLLLLPVLACIILPPLLHKWCNISWW